MSADPLREIVDLVWHRTGVKQYGVEIRALHEKLKCGHVIPIRQGRFGPSKAKRRRCHACSHALGQMRGLVKST